MEGRMSGQPSARPYKKHPSKALSKTGSQGTIRQCQSGSDAHTSIILHCEGS